MKRSLTFLSALALLTFGILQSAFAQDDVYYDPNKDKGSNTSTQQPQYDDANSGQETNNTTPNTGNQADKTDGYGNPADKYDPRDNYDPSAYDNNQYSTDAGYYDEDYDSYFYTTRLRRYYTPNYGTPYYSYWFTPSYYIGVNTWNTAYVVSYNPWYQDPWWGWNRRGYQPVSVMYDPFWSWNFGWNTCSYYNSWSNPYYGGYSSWGYNGWGYNNGGFCGGYYNGYNNGYYNGYYNGYGNGYYDGYNNGYYNGYGGSANNGGYYYHGPRHHRDATADAGTGGGNPTTKPVDQPGTNGNSRPTDIPRTGITKPLNPGVSTNTASGNNGGVKVETATPRPYTEANVPANGAGKPGVNVVPMNGTNAGNVNRWDDKVVKANPSTGVNIPSANSNPAAPNETGKSNKPATTNSTWPFVQENNVPKDWNQAPPTRWNNGQPVPAEQPNRATWNGNNTPKQDNQPAYGEQQRNNQPQNNTPQPRPQTYGNGGRVEQRPVEQPRTAPQGNYQPQRNEPANTQPRTNYQPRNEQPQRMAPQSAPQQSRPQMSQPNNNNGGSFNRMEPRSSGGSYSAPQQQQRSSPSPSMGSGSGGMRRGGR